MNYRELIKKVAVGAGKSQRETGQIIDHVISVIASTLESGETVRLLRLGALEVRTYDAHNGHHPKTGEPLQIPARRGVSFRAATVLREALRRPVEKA